MQSPLKPYYKYSQTPGYIEAKLNQRIEIMLFLLQ